MALFFEQRRWRHLGGVPPTAELAYEREVIAALREISAGYVEDQRPISL